LLYETLARPAFAKRVDWRRVHLFWGDERCVPLDDLRSNYAMARSTLLDQVPIPPGNIHPLYRGGSPSAAADAYEKLLQSHFTDQPAGFDLVLLGLGEDGHTASIFPGAGPEDNGRLVVVAQKPGEDIMRLTLTVPMLNRSCLVLFIVSGAAKACILKRVLNDPGDVCRLPAQLVNPSEGKVIWMADRDAAALLALPELTVLKAQNHD
jgi:6-phosphogluconolactonase